MDFPEDGDFMYEAIKKKLQMKKRVNNIEIQGIKKILIHGFNYLLQLKTYY